MSEENQLIITSSPHVRSKEDVSSIMRDVLIALLPAALAGVYFYRIPALINLIAGVGGAVLAEFLIQKFMKRKVTIKDYSAAVTGLLIAMNVSPILPWWMTLIGAFFAIIVVKQLFGGIGHNFVNPALIARAVLMSSWPAAMTRFVSPGPDSITSATPLAVLKGLESTQSASVVDLFIGNVAGCIGETSALLLLVGGIYLIFRGVISYRIPVVYILTVAVLTFIFSGFKLEMPLYNVIGGGLFLGAFFMATDYTTSPVSAKAQVIYAFGCGLLTSVIRYYGGYAEGVSYSILLMNVATPILDKYIKNRTFGEVRSNG